jgi:hypothetical protein
VQKLWVADLHLTVNGWRARATLLISWQGWAPSGSGCTSELYCSTAPTPALCLLIQPQPIGSSELLGGSTASMRDLSANRLARRGKVHPHSMDSRRAIEQIHSRNQLRRTTGSDPAVGPVRDAGGDLINRNLLLGCRHRWGRRKDPQDGDCGLVVRTTSSSNEPTTWCCSQMHMDTWWRAAVD